MFAFSRLLTAALMIALTVALPANAQEPPNVDPARIAAAKELMDATGMTNQMDSMIAVMGDGFRKGARDAGGGRMADKLGDELDQHMQRLMSYREAMIEEFAVIYAERFTAEELNAVSDFYRSPTGKKFIAASPELMQAGAQIGIKYSQKAMQKPEKE